MLSIRTTAAILGFSATVLFSPLALAGGCPTCTSAADCKGISADAVCVEWNEDPGCGGKLMICCPGQGCAVDSNGMPSCVATGKCKLVGSAGAGGGAGTAGSAGAASGGSAGAAAGGSAGSATGGTTSGSGGSVSGGGSGNAPGGSSGDDGGCGCRVSNKGAPTGLALLLAGVAVALRRRRG